MLERRRNLSLALACTVLVACHKPPPSAADAATPREAGVVLRDASAPSSAAAPDASLAPLPPLPPLAWGTRPPEGELDLYPALDGPCRIAVFPLVDTTIVNLGYDGLLRATEDGLDTDVGRGLAAASRRRDEYHDDVVAVSGRKDDLWVQRESAGSVFRDARVLRRRADGSWKLVAPRGTDRQHYAPPEPFRGGALGFAYDLRDGYDDPKRAVLGFDLPSDVSPGRLLPGGKAVRGLHALAEGDLLVEGETAGGGAPAMFLLPAGGGPARTLGTKALGTSAVSLVGRTRAALRLVAGDKRFRLEEDTFVREEIESAPAWRKHGRAVQHLVGAGYREVPLPKLPISGRDAEVKDLVVAHDGEVFVVARAASAGEDRDALYRSRRPSQVLRCTERGTDGEVFDPSDVYGPATSTGVEPWPPAADASCTTPFVVAFRYRERQKVPNDFPRARAALAKGGHDVVLEEVLSGSRRVVGVRARDMALAEAVAATLKKDIGAKTEIVCATPAPGRRAGEDAGAR